MREEQKQVPSVAEWAMIADAILAAPVDRNELLDMASIASRVQTQALVQYGQTPSHDSRNDELLTPAQIRDETGMTLWAIREKMHRHPDQVWRPHPKAVRNLKVRRGIARLWAGGIAGTHP